MTEENKVKKRWAKEDDAAVEEAILALLEHRQGRKFLWFLLQLGGVGFQPYANNALQTAFNCGTLNVGNQILERLLRTSPEGYITMMKENADERATRDAELGVTRDADRGRSGTGPREPDLYDG